MVHSTLEHQWVAVVNYERLSQEEGLPGVEILIGGAILSLEIFLIFKE